MDPFHPVKSYTHSVLAATSLLVTLDLNTGLQRLIYNAGSAPVFYTIGAASNLTADATGHILPAGAMIGISLRSSDAYMAFYSASPATIYVSAGEGE